MNFRISTSELNKFILPIVQNNPPPSNKGKIIKAVFNKKTAFNPLVSGDPSKIFQER